MSMEMVQRQTGKINIVLQNKNVEESYPNPATYTASNDKMMQYIDQQFSSFVGLQEIKYAMKEIYALKLLNEKRKTYHMPTNKQVLHMMFKGNPGTGKTTVARKLAHVFFELGILSKGHFIEAERADIVGEYIGQTAQKTRMLIQKAQGGVLFIDEAYSLGRGGHKDFGREAIDTIVKQMEDYHEDFVLILAGYPQEMERFLYLNPGLRSRFAYHMDFSDYNLTSLMEITRKMLKEKDYELTASAEHLIRSHLQETLHKKPLHFSNARYVRNVIEKAIRKQAIRLMSTQSLSPTLIKQITKEDIDFNSLDK